MTHILRSCDLCRTVFWLYTNVTNELAASNIGAEMRGTRKRMRRGKLTNCSHEEVSRAAFGPIRSSYFLAISPS
jgi:hypothetical protein